MSSKLIEAIEKITEINSPEHKEIYANGTTVRMSVWDIGIIFSQQKVPNVRENQATITMSPNHFKAFTAAMNKTLEAYESQFGVINVPKELMTAGIIPKISEKVPKIGKPNAKRTAAKKTH